MNEIQRLDEQLKLSFEGPSWHGPSLLEALDGVAAEQANAHPIPTAHSIWELVLHLTATYRLVLRRLDGDTRALSSDEDWPEIPSPTASDWEAAMAGLRSMNDQLREAVLRFDPERLDSPLIPDPPYTTFTQLIGVTQHNLFHAGQIILLKKAFL